MLIVLINILCVQLQMSCWSDLSHLQTSRKASWSPVSNHHEKRQNAMHDWSTLLR